MPRFGELLHEFIAMRDPRDRLDLLRRRMRPGERDVLGDRPVEQKVVLQDDAELRAIVGQPHRVEIAAVHQDPALLGAVECQNQADERAFTGPR